MSLINVPSIVELLNIHELIQQTLLLPSHDNLMSPRYCKVQNNSGDQILSRDTIQGKLFLICLITVSLFCLVNPVAAFTGFLNIWLISQFQICFLLLLIVFLVKSAIV